MEIGTGWIGWTEEQTLKTSIPVILAAYRGRVKMLNSVLGGDDTPKPGAPGDLKAATPENLKATLRGMAAAKPAKGTVRAPKKK